MFVVDFDPSAAYLSVSGSSAVASHQSCFFFLPQDLTSTLIQIRTVSLIYANAALALAALTLCTLFIYLSACFWSPPKPGLIATWPRVLFHPCMTPPALPKTELGIVAEQRTDT